MARDAVIEVRDLTVQFGRRPLFSRLTFSVQAGQRVLIRGASGAGKSTLLSCLLGFVTPQEGQIWVRGEQLTPRSVWSIRRQWGYLAQESDLGRGTVAEALEAPFRFAANQADAVNAGRIETLFERFLLDTDLLTQEVTQLSGGQKQRVALIGAILLNRQIYLLDEPTSALDAPSRQAVLEFFSGCGATLLWISHESQPLFPPDQVVKVTPGEEHA
jgi:ABC-type multidrug transport system ATPase subunit